MARPEIVGAPVLTAGASVRSLGLDVFVPADITNSNLFVGAGWKQGTGSTTAVVLRVDGGIAGVGASISPTGSDNLRFTIGQFQNLAAGRHRVHVEPSTISSFDAAFLFAILLRDSGEFSTILIVTAFPFTTASIPATSRYLMAYWGYQATDVSGGQFTEILRNTELAGSLGGLVIQTATRSTTGTLTAAPNHTGETLGIGAYIVAPLA